MKPLLSRHRSLLLAIGSCLLTTAHGQIADQRPTPDWLSGAARYEVRFEHRQPLFMGILLVAAEREVEVIVNDQPAGGAADPAKVSSLDLTSRLRVGANTIVLRSKDGQPVRAAALLEWKGDLASRHWLATGISWTTPSGPVVDRTPVPSDPALNPFDPGKAVDAYSSWKLAQRGQQSQATDPATFSLPPGFKAELIRSAQPDEDSWVAMTFDPEGRITLAREKRGLLRLDPAGEMEIIDDTLLECRGLLYAHDALYAHANNSKALFRLRDADGDGTFEERSELLRTEGGVGHGRNHLKLGPDGHLWIANGNNVILPPSLSPESPLRHYAEDQVLPNPWDSAMFDGNVVAPAGHILRMHPESGQVELFAGGLRNPIGLAFNREGELFTFDADMEWDLLAPWYMPNRVLHLVSAADYGWRRGTGRFPASYPDTLPAVADIGLGSPTAVFFGYGGKMPARYTEALFLCDWAYGRILALPLQPDGASYTGKPEPFLSGRPLNVTDGGVGPDGAIWFITGGRGTQSGLYRVGYDGSTVDHAPKPDAPLRDLRHRLEAFHRGIAKNQQQDALALIAPNLEHPDRFIRHAARIAIERLPIDLWQHELLARPDGWTPLLAALTLARVGESDAASALYERLGRFDWETLDPEKRLALLRVFGVALARFGDPGEATRRQFLAVLEPGYPTAEPALNEEYCRLLVRLQSPSVLTKTLKILREADSPGTLVFYSLHLRYLKSGWEPGNRRAVLTALKRASEYPDGGRNYTKAILDLQTEYTAALTPAERLELTDLLPKPAAPAPELTKASLVREWTLEELAPLVDRGGSGRSFARGRAAVVSTGCVLCHRVSTDPALPAGLLGPDLLQVAARFGRRDLLDHILHPSKVVEEKYRLLTITRNDGVMITGSLESEDDERLMVRPNPLAPDLVAIGKSQIAKREESATSTMPPGLLNSLTADQILDLLAFLEAGGNAGHRSFRP
jgi:hypothetical protein